MATLAQDPFVAPLIDERDAALARNRALQAVILPHASERLAYRIRRDTLERVLKGGVNADR